MSKGAEVDISAETQQNKQLNHVECDRVTYNLEFLVKTNRNEAECVERAESSKLLAEVELRETKSRGCRVQRCVGS